MFAHLRACLLVALLAAPVLAQPKPKPPADPKAEDARTLWKHDGGTYEKTGKGTWVEKRGTDTHELTEKAITADSVRLYDTKRKLNVYLRAGAASSRVDGQPVDAEKLKGDWVAAADKPKEPDPKAPADPKADAPPTPTADKTVWTHAGGWFAKTGDGKWTERRGKDTFELAEGRPFAGSVILEDAARKLKVTLKNESAQVLKDGQKIKDAETLTGGWVKYEPKSDLDPKADGRTVWKAADVTYELSAPGVWTEVSGGNFKTVKKYTQKAVTDEYVELLDEEHKLKWVRLTATARLERLTELNKYKAEGRPGGWVKADKPVDPKAAGKYAEAAKLAPEKVEGVVAVSPDGTQVSRKLGDPFNAEYGVVEVATGKVVNKWKEDGGTVAAAWSADGKTFATYSLPQAGKDGKPSRVVVRDAGTWGEKATFDLTGFHSALSVSADGSRVAALTGTDREVRAVVLDVATKKELFSKPMGGAVFLSADGKTVGGTAGAKGEFVTFDVGTGKAKAEYAVKGRPVMSADTGAVAAYDYDFKTGTTLSVWEGTAKTPKTVSAKGFQASAVVFLDAGRHVAAFGHSFNKPKGDVVKVFSLKAMAEVDSFLVGKESDLVSASYLGATPDGGRLLTFGVDKYLRVWGTPFGEKKDDKK